MSRDQNRKGYFNRDPRNRGRDWERPDYRGRPGPPRKSRSPGPVPLRSDIEKRISRSPRKNDKDLLDENIMSEISKLPEPSELWDNQFQDGTFSGPPPPSFQSEPANPSYASNYQPSYSSGIYDDFPTLSSVPIPPQPPEIGTWNQMSLPPPPNVLGAPFITTPEDQLKKEGEYNADMEIEECFAAIETEMRHQKAALSKQREDYMKKAGILKKELDTLKDQRNELRGDAKRSPSPDTKRFLKENTKLQLEIQNKLKTINNVVDMLNGIIGEDATELHQDSDDSERGSKRKSRSPSAGRKFNYVYYDPEMHWCRVCNEFPPTAKDYLNHLHSPAHHKMAAAHMEAPWHGVTGVNEGFPGFPSAPTKRTPIRGLQFFVPSTAWYCKLCDQFIGDLHCASAHLKSVVHSKNYTNFVEQNPHWETDWMSDRQKAFEKARANKGKLEDKPQYTAHTITFNKDGFHTKRKESPVPPPEEKKKKDKKKKKSKRRRSSSSSSSSDSSSSDSEPARKKKKKKDKLSAADDKTLTEWMSAIQADRLNDNDRKLLDTLKSRIKVEKQDEEERRSPSRSERERSADARKRVDDRRESRARDTRDRERRDDARRRDERERRDERRRDERAHTSPPRETKKPEIKKMPFIGKMPVYKSLGKSKSEDQKKEEQKKKEDEEASKKRREEMDAEIQKKVAEFKEKIAKAQLDRQQQVELPPPAIALPTQLGTAVPHAYLPPAPPAPAPAPPAPAPQPLLPAQPPPTPQPPTLPKDFQEALDIIFPTDVKPDLSQADLFGGMPGLPPGFPMGLGGVMPPFPPFLQPQMPPQMMMGFDMNGPPFLPRPQLYDTHVPLVPSPKPRQNNRNRQNQNKNNQIQNKNNQNQNKNKNQQNRNNQNKQAQNKKPENGDAARKKEQMDDLAMLGIDASDVAGM